MSTSRETVRDSLVVLLAAKLVGVGLPVKTVTGSKVEDLSGLTPLVSVLSAGTFRERTTFKWDRPAFWLEVQVWVRQATTGWTNAQAEDALDTIEQLIAEVYQDNRGTASWEMIEYAEPSSVLEVAVAGVPCYLERIPTLVRLVHS